MPASGSWRSTSRRSSPATARSRPQRGVRAVRDYLAYIRAEARRRFDAGLSARDAAFDIALGDYASWGDAERIAVNVATLYREFANDPKPANVVELFASMAELHRSRRR